MRLNRGPRRRSSDEGTVDSGASVSQSIVSLDPESTTGPGAARGGSSGGGDRSGDGAAASGSGGRFALGDSGAKR